MFKSVFWQFFSMCFSALKREKTQLFFAWERMKKAFVTKTTLQEELEIICASIPIHLNDLEMKLPQLRKEELKRINSVTETQGKTVLFHYV